MALCPKCGAQLEEGARFCAECGFDAASAQNVNVNPAANSYSAQSSNNNNHSASANNSYSAYQQQYANAYSGYSQPYQQTYANLVTTRNWVSMFFLSIITLGIYGLVWWTNFVNDVNLIIDRRDFKHSTHYCIMVFFVIVQSLGIGGILWMHNMARRIGLELSRRGINYDFGPGAFWGWAVLGSLIVVGPFVYMHKLTKALNLLCSDYNQKG